MYFKVVITETGRNTLKEQAHIFNDDIAIFKTLEEVKEHLTNRYGTIPKRTNNNTIYRDLKNGQTVKTGFTKSYWNKDISHNSSSWYQTDWVEITQVEETIVLVN